MKLYCSAFNGLQAEEVEIEVSFTRGLPAFGITGLAGNTIQESKQRVQSSLLQNGFKFPPVKISVNLSPSDLPKQGSFYDVPIALLIVGYNEMKFQKELQEITQEEKGDKNIPTKWFAFGELGLDGRIKNTPNIYPLLFSLLAQKSKYERMFILPKDGEEIFSKIPNLKAFYVSTLKEAIEIFINKDQLSLPKTEPTLPFKSIVIGDQSYYYSDEFALDFSDVLGQTRAKRAALIAASGMHNLLLEGSAGCGKSMIASRIPHILPPLSLDEILQIATLESMGDYKELELSAKRPFRNPHATATKAAMLGSATPNGVKYGEIALAHLGVLFLDELPHFPKNILESLREPLENQNFSLSRLHAKITYPTSFLFIGAQNPCPCGNLLSTTKECRCNQKEINAYKNRLSEPFLDRIDLIVPMQEESRQQKKGESSKELFEKVLKAFVMQKERKQTTFNGKLNATEIEKFCKLDKELDELLDGAMQKFALSLRVRQKTLRVARTIADLAQSPSIQKTHLLEALSFRVS